MNRTDSSDIILSNIRASGIQIGRAVEIRLSHLSELAEKLAKSDDYESFRDAFCNVREEFSDIYREILRENISSVNLSEVRRILDGLSIRGFAEVCADVAKERKFAYGDIDTEPISSARIACFKTAPSQSAYRAFARELAMASESVYDDYSSICEAVFTGAADFCILPVWGSDDGVLLPFLRLARKYELHAVLSCDIQPSDDDRQTRFCLFGSKIKNRRGSDTVDLFVSTADENIHRLLSGIDQIGGSCQKLTALPHAMFPDENLFCSVRIGRENIDALLLFLRLFAQSVSVCGIYKCITAPKTR